MRSKRSQTARSSLNELQKTSPTLPIPCLSISGLSASTRRRLVPGEVWEVLLVDILAKKAALMVRPNPGGPTVMVLVTRQASTGFSAAPIWADPTVAKYARTHRDLRRAA